MKKIKLTKGKFAIVDNKDFKWLNSFNWHYNAGYAIRREKKIILMHRQIIQTPVGLETDHINGDTLDNRRKNLRIVTRSQNSFNKNYQQNNTSGFKGVFWRKDRSKWLVKVSHKYIGLFDDKIKAAKAYDNAVVKIDGKFAKLNFPL